MVKRILMAMLAVGLCAWMAGPATRLALGDEGPKKDAGAAKAQAAKQAPGKEHPAKDAACEKERGQHQRRAPGAEHRRPFPGRQAMHGRHGRQAFGPESWRRHDWAGPQHRGAGRFEARGQFGHFRGGPGMMGRGQFGHFRGGPGMAGRGGRPGMGPQGWKPPTASEMFERLDKNKDGKLTKDEVPERMWQFLSKADANKDGAISKEELEAARKTMQEQMQQRRPRWGGTGGGPQAGPAQGWKPPTASEMFERLDKNKDGKLTKDEVPERVWQFLSKADANKDGAVSKEEVEAAHKKMAEQRAKQPQ